MSITPATRVKIGITKADITYIAGKNKNLNKSQVKYIIKAVLLETLKLTTIELTHWINSKVPKRTGQLRENLIKNLKSSRVQKNLLRLIIGTSIEYAKEVDAYTTSQVRHSGEKGYAYYYGKYGKIKLQDPRAIGGFWGKLLIFAKERILINLSKAKYKYIGSTKMTSKQMSKVDIK